MPGPLIEDQSYNPDFVSSGEAMSLSEKTNGGLVAAAWVGKSLPLREPYIQTLPTQIQSTGYQLFTHNPTTLQQADKGYKSKQQTSNE